MAQIRVPDAPTEYATQYKQLLGVDYQNDQTEVDRRRSPDMVNMISDYGGNPVKRDGFRTVGDAYASIVSVDGVTYGIYNSFRALTVATLEMGDYEYSETDTDELLLDIGDINTVFTHQKSIYVKSEDAIVEFDTENATFKYVGIGTAMMSASNVGESAPIMTDNIPDTVIQLKPDGTGGAAYYNKNLFSIYQRVSYLGDGTSTAYTIPNYKKIGTYVKAEVKNASGEWVAATVSVGSSTSKTGKKLDGSGNMTSSVVDPVVTFSTAPASAGSLQEDNVRITFCPYDVTEVETGVCRGYYNEEFVNLLNSSITAFQKQRLFIADSYKTYYSEVNDPFFVSDLSWFEVDSDIVCYTRASSYLAILTNDNNRNTIYLASEESKVVDNTTGETESYFSVKPSNSGIAAIAPKCIGVLSDEPVFLAKTGLFGLLTNWQSEKYAVARSSRINRRMCKEQNLQNAVGIAWNDYFYIAINGRMYVLDARHKESDRAGNKPFEAYFFDEMPTITDMYIVGDRMLFTDGESTYTWNDDLPDTKRYYDYARNFNVTRVQYVVGDSPTAEPTGEWEDEMPEIHDGEYLWYAGTLYGGGFLLTRTPIVVGDNWIGKPVAAKWSSVFDDDGAPQKLKTLMKKGTMVTIVPHYKSGVQVTLIKDGDEFEPLGYKSASLTSFENISFDSFSFSANTVAFDNFTKKKIKKYKRLQIVLENDRAEPFGITKIVKTYTVGNYAKR